MTTHPPKFKKWTHRSRKSRLVKFEEIEKHQKVPKTGKMQITTRKDPFFSQKITKNPKIVKTNGISPLF